MAREPRLSWRAAEGWLSRGKNVLWVSVGCIALLLGAYISIVHWQFDMTKGTTHATEHLLNIFAIVGVPLGVLGLFWTYLQLKFANDRIEGYAKFYEWALSAIDEIKAYKCESFQFSGSTIQPGNIAFEDSRRIDEFSEELKHICHGERLYRSLQQVSLVIPNERAYESSYSYYKTRRLARTRHKSDWLGHVETQRKKAVQIQQLCRSGKATACNLIELSTTDERNSWLKSYYLSNGRRVVYAVPLHFSTSAEEKEGDFTIIQPQLVGFTSTDPGVVAAFSSQFEELFRPELNEAELQNMLAVMYDRHLVYPGYVQNRVNEAIHTGANASLIFDEYSQDHFGKLQATKECIAAIGIGQQSRVLDIGSGLGGPAIYIAKQCPTRQVTGIELRQDRFDFSRQMASSYNVGNVTFEKWDALQYLSQAEPHGRRFTHLISFLTILHLPNKREFLEAMGTLLEDKGQVFIEDYCCTKNLNTNERKRLLNAIACPGLLDVGEYIRCLELGGIRVTTVIDLTSAWTEEASGRVNEYTNNRGGYEPYAGAERLNAALDFATEVLSLFKDKLISGVRIVGRKVE